MKVEGADEDDFGAGRYCGELVGDFFMQKQYLGGKDSILLMCSSVLLHVRFILGNVAGQLRQGFYVTAAAALAPGQFVSRGIDA